MSATCGMRDTAQATKQANITTVIRLNTEQNLKTTILIVRIEKDRRIKTCCSHRMTSHKPNTTNNHRRSTKQIQQDARTRQCITTEATAVAAATLLLLLLLLSRYQLTCSCSSSPSQQMSCVTCCACTVCIGGGRRYSALVSAAACWAPVSLERPVCLFTGQPEEVHDAFCACMCA